MLDTTPPATSDPWLAVWGGTISSLLADIAELTRKDRLAQAQVHKARREIKRLRALLHLAPHPIAGLAEDIRLAAGTMRQHLGFSRDAAVMLDTLSALAGRMGDAASRLRKVLAGHKRSVEATRPEGATADDRERLAQLVAAWRAREPHGSLTALRTGAVRTYRKARKRTEALGSGDAAAVHQLRKAAVDHQYHLAFFAAKTGKLHSRHQQVKRLRRSLGTCHDLDQLRDFVRGRADISASDLIALESAMAGRRRRLLAQAQKSAAKLFDPKPRRFGRRLKHGIGAAPAPFSGSRVSARPA